jgi:hypothetical protein
MNATLDVVGKGTRGDVSIVGVGDGIISSGVIGVISGSKIDMSIGFDPRSSVVLPDGDAVEVEHPALANKGSTVNKTIVMLAMRNDDLILNMQQI